ncbi:MAG: hypothetical protein L3K02_08060, partial [Thermoplasmata archaeon]|nr:hypothetical protein [Thermoplasmata archaeon]
MVFDSTDQEIVLFGGQAGGLFLNDTWVYAGGNWSQVPVSGAYPPAPRQYAGLADDPPLGGVLLFAGQNPGGVDGDTWKFSAGHWTNLTPALTSAPPPRRAALMAYDSTNGSVLLFGGDASLSGQDLSDTWRFDAGRWFNLSGGLSPSPAGRFATTMADDPAVNGTLLFGGCTSVGCVSYLGDTWTWQDIPLTLRISPLSVTGFTPLSVDFTAEVNGGLPPYRYDWA